MDLLKVYGECWGGEAGEWNTSLENKYLEYMFAKFFEDNFSVAKNFHILNIGIGAGYWDRYLSYKVKEGSLTSIDIDNEICKNFIACLENENNPNTVNVICSDALSYNFKAQFDIVTLVGSSASETGNTKLIIEKAISLVKENGALYLQLLHSNLTDIEKICANNCAKIDKALFDDSYGISAQYYKIVK